MIAFACMSLYIISWLVDIIRSDWLEGTVLEKPLSTLWQQPAIILLYHDPQQDSRKLQRTNASTPSSHASFVLIKMERIMVFRDRRQP